MKRKILALLLALLLCAGLIAPVLATAAIAAPEIEIQWLPFSDEPMYYISEFTG